MRKGIVTVTCSHCGTSFERERWRAKRSKNQYCSRRCSQLASRKFDPDREELESLYHDQQLTCAEIGERYGVTESSVRDRMILLKIPLRTRAERAALDWARADQERREAAKERLNEWRESNRDRFAEFAAKAAKASQEINGPTSIEQAMMDALDVAGIEYVYQYPVGDKFVCDLYIPDGDLIVECDGIYWHSTPLARRRDKSKDAYLAACGFQVLRFTGDQIRADTDECLDAILDHLDHPSQ